MPLNPPVEMSGGRDGGALTRGAAKRANTCLRCKVENPDAINMDVSTERGWCWLCEDCYGFVEVGCCSVDGDCSVKVGSPVEGGAPTEADAVGLVLNDGSCEKIASLVVAACGLKVDGLVSKIADKLVEYGVEGSGLEDRVGVERGSFADVANAKKPSTAKIVVKNGGDGFVNRASEALSKTPVTYLKQEKDGSVTIAVPDEESLSSAEKRLTEIMPENAQVTRSVRHPKITIRDFPLPAAASAQDATARDKRNAMITEAVKIKNPDLRDMIERGDKFDVVYVGKSGDGRTTAPVGVRVSSDIRDLLTRKGRVFVGNSSCRVEDRHYIPQCYKCQRYGHKSNECEQTSYTCKFCAGSHDTRRCTDMSRVCCANCMKSRDPQLRGRAFSHNAGSLDCPVYHLKLKNSKN